MDSPEERRRLGEMLEARSDYLAAVLASGECADQMVQAVFKLLAMLPAKRRDQVPLVKELAKGFSAAQSVEVEKGRRLDDCGDQEPDIRLIRSLIVLPKIGPLRLRALAVAPRRTLKWARSAWGARIRLIQTVSAYALVRGETIGFLARRDAAPAPSNFNRALEAVGEEDDLGDKLGDSFLEVVSAVDAHDIARDTYTGLKGYWESKMNSTVVTLINLLVVKDVSREVEVLSPDHHRIIRELTVPKPKSRLWLPDSDW
jgi:hypothetical protein